MDPSFFDVLFSEYLFIGTGLSLLDEDSGEGLVAAALDSKTTAELCEARLLFGLEHVENKVFNDLGVKESDLGPKDAIITGKFAWGKQTIT